jgi:hypothetical protein
MLSPQAGADKWAQKAGGAVADYKAGIQGVQSAPGQAAVAAQNVMLQNWNEAVNSGRWAARTGAVPLEVWKQAAITKGGANYGTGITAGKAKMAASNAYYYPVAASVKEAVKSIPRDGGAGSLARVQLNMEAFKNAKMNRR